MGGLRRKHQQQQSDDNESNSSKHSKQTPISEQVEEWRFEAVIVSLLTLTDDDNRLICPPFRVLPTPEDFPLYYEHIKKPIDLKTIAENVRNGKYTTWGTFEADIHLMVKNAKEFNEPASMIYKDASRLLHHFQSIVPEFAEARRYSQRVISRKKEIIDELLRATPSEFDEFSEDSEEDEESETSDDAKWKLYWTIRNYTSLNGVPLCQNFMELPSKRNYPDYYEEIEHPISLYMINKKLKRGQYTNLDELVASLLLMFDNACAYNMDGSDIFKAAIRLRKLTLDIAKELSSTICVPKCEIAAILDELPNKAARDVDSTTIKNRGGGRREAIRNNTIKQINNKVNNDEMIGLEVASTSLVKEQKNDVRRRKQFSPVEKQQKKGRKSIDELRENFTKLLMDVWQDVLNLKMGNRNLSDSFLYLPCDKRFPDYYKSIKKPMSLTCIKNKIVDFEYHNSDEMLDDIKLMCKNAQTYNRPGSQIVSDSSIIESVAFGSMQSKTGGSPIKYPLRRSDKGWNERSSTEKSPAKTPRKKQIAKSAAEFHDNETASTSQNISTTKIQVNILPAVKMDGSKAETIISQFHPHPLHPGVYIAAASAIDGAPPISTDESRSFAIQKIHSPILSLTEKLKNRDHLSNEYKKIYSLLEALLLLRSDDDRLLAESFVKLPSREEYKAYYLVIKCPIDLTRVVDKLTSQQYDIYQQFFTDLYLVFENACKFNEPDSSVYKDAIVLLREVIRMRKQLFNEELSENKIYHHTVQMQVQKILKQLLHSLMDYKDSSGRNLSEKLNKIYHKSGDGYCSNFQINECIFSLEKIRENTEKGLYKRLDRLQEDLFALFTFTRENVDVDSEDFSDLLELQQYFIDERELLCKNVLCSPASIYTRSLLDDEVSELRKIKDREKRGYQRSQKIHNGGLCENGSFDSLVRSSNEDSNDQEGSGEIQKPTEPNITHEPRITEKETAHLINNVHDVSDTFQILDIHREEVLDRRQHSDRNNEKPVDFFSHQFGNIYYQQMEHNGKFYRLGDGVLVFKEGKSYCDIMRIDRLWKTKSGEKMFSGARFARPSELKHEPSEMFYKQEIIALKSIDAVERMINIQGSCAILTQKQYEQLRPTEIPECDIFLVERKVLGPTKFDEKGTKIPLSWKNCSIIAARGTLMDQQDELFDQQQEMDMDNSRTLRKLKNYNLAREVAEDEIYYFKQPLRMEKILSPLVMNPNSSDHALPITHNELDNEEAHIFSKEIKRKRHLTTEDEEEDLLEQDEEFEFNPGIHLDRHQEYDGQQVYGIRTTPLNLHANNIYEHQAGSDTSRPYQTTTEHDASTSFSNSTPTSSTPRSRNNGNAKGTSWLATQPKLNAKSKSGYILFSAEIRKRVMNENPDSGFGEVSRKVGIEWKRLSDEQKRQYETRAQYIAEERAKAELLTPTSKMPQPGQIRVHCCRWMQCDFQFDCQEGLFEHIQTSHTSQLDSDEDQYVCLWNSCVKYRKEGKPFPSLPRLHRHLKEKHLASTIRFMFPNQRTKNYFVYLPPQNPQPTTSSAKNNSNVDHGRFVHHPYGEVASNAPACSVATPLPHSTNSNQFGAVSAPTILPTSNSASHTHVQNHGAISAALGGSSLATPPPVRYMCSPTTAGMPHKSSHHGSTMLNGIMPPPPSQTTTTNSQTNHHYVIQQQQPTQSVRQQPVYQLPPNNLPQQTVVIPSGQQAIVVNGVTVYIPANAQTIILPPGYTGPQQQHQIVVHTQPPPPPTPHLPSQQLASQHLPMMTNGPMAQLTPQSQYANASIMQHQPYSHQQMPPQIQQNATGNTAFGQHASHSQYHQHLNNSLPGSSVHGAPSTQFVGAPIPAAISHPGSSQLSSQQIPSHQQQQSLSLPAPSTTTITAHQPASSRAGTSHHQQLTTAAHPGVQHSAQYQNSSQALSQAAQAHPIIDPGRTVVTAPKPLEPVFVAQSNSVTIKRVVHSESYVKYLETIYNNSSHQHTISKWDNALQASQKNTTAPNQRKPPYEWIRQAANGSKAKEEEVLRAFWQLRDHLLEGTTGISMPNRTGIESAPRPPGYDGPGTNNNEDNSRKKN